ncbi:MAG: 50S ribosomal protein L35 [Patescibacteria group bacterium]|jgi:large subunit ribosomal protein L35
MKTHKAISKRFKITRTGKVLKRVAGQDHYNSREPGKVTRNKRRDSQLEGRVARNVKKAI